MVLYLLKILPFFLTSKSRPTLPPRYRRKVLASRPKDSFCHGLNRGRTSSATRNPFTCSAAGTGTLHVEQPWTCRPCANILRAVSREGGDPLRKGVRGVLSVEVVERNANGGVTTTMSAGQESRHPKWIAGAGRRSPGEQNGTKRSSP